MNTIPGSSYIEKLSARKVDFISNLVENYRKLHNPNCIIIFFSCSRVLSQFFKTKMFLTGNSNFQGDFLSMSGKSFDSHS